MIDSASPGVAPKGIAFIREPKAAPYGTGALLKDLRGNRWGLALFAAKAEGAARI